MAMNPYQGDDVPYDQTDDAKNLASAQAREDLEYQNSMKGLKSYDIDDRDRRENAMVKASGAALKKAKAPVVTKEQLKASGYTNLRDYMNAQKGLKRRDGKAPSKISPAMPDAAATKKAAMDKAFGGSAIKALEARNARKEADRRAALPTGVSFPEDDPRLRRERAELEAAHDRDTDIGMKKGGKVGAKKQTKKYVKGGKIDGCAMRGKTKGRMV